MLGAGRSRRSRRPAAELRRLPHGHLLCAREALFRLGRSQRDVRAHRLSRRAGPPPGQRARLRRGRHRDAAQPRPTRPPPARHGVAAGRHRTGHQNAATSNAGQMRAPAWSSRRTLPPPTRAGPCCGSGVVGRGACLVAGRARVPQGRQGRQARGAAAGGWALPGAGCAQIARRWFGHDAFPSASGNGAVSRPPLR